MLKIVKKSLGNNPTETMKHEPMTSKLEKAKKASQLVYKVLVEKKGSLPAKMSRKMDVEL